MKLNQAQGMTPVPPIELPDPTEAEIQKEAYYLWIENGRPEGRDLEFWDAARELLRHRHAGAPGHGQPPGPVVVHFPPSHEAQRPAAKPARH